MKMEKTECSETSAYKIQTPGNYPKKAYNIQNTAKVWNHDYPLHVSNKQLFIIRRLFLYTKHTVFYHASVPFTSC